MATSCAERGCATLPPGGRAEHCPCCHLVFVGSRAGNIHRVGPFEPAGMRRCLTPKEMLSRGMTLDRRGYWQEGGARRRGEVRRDPRWLVRS